jgi:hypothetical protein
MKEAKVIPNPEPVESHPLKLDDFSRFKEKVIMINTLKSLVEQTDKATFKMIAKQEDGVMTGKSLKRALEAIVDQAIKRVHE